MAKTMKAAVVHEFKQPLRIEEVPVPTPGAGQIVVKIAATGVCHTDLHAAEGDWPVKPRPPFIPGHEGAGVVAAVGPGVSGLKEGDPVGVAWLHDACGTCEHCITGWETLCEAQHNSGYSVDGAFAEYVIGSAAYVGRIPDRPEFAATSRRSCVPATVYKSLKVTDTKPGDWVVISASAASASGGPVCQSDGPERHRRGCGRLQARSRQEIGRFARRQCARPIPLRSSKEVGGAQGVLVTAVSPKAAEQAMGMVVAAVVSLMDAAGHLPNLHLRYGAQRHHGTRLDRRHPPRSTGGAEFRRRGQGQGHHCDRQAGEHQQDLRSHARR